jgi:plasmid stabilization system protein ParE
MTTVVVVETAEQQLREIVAWWKENRLAAPDLVLREFVRCIRLLETAPDVGPRFRRTEVVGVRRLIMKRTRHLLYYLHDETHEIVYVIAVWGAPKEGDPVLFDPRR